MRKLPINKGKGVLWKARLEKNMRAEDVAKEANISAPTYLSLENGNQRCTIKNLQKVCDVLGIELEDGIRDFILQ